MIPRWWQMAILMVLWKGLSIVEHVAANVMNTVYLEDAREQDQR